jgi:hypothetical protein
MPGKGSRVPLHPVDVKRYPSLSPSYLSVSGSWRARGSSLVRNEKPLLCVPDQQELATSQAPHEQGICPALGKWLELRSMTSINTSRAHDLFQDTPSSFGLGGSGSAFAGMCHAAHLHHRSLGPAAIPYVNLVANVACRDQTTVDVQERHGTGSPTASPAGAILNSGLGSQYDVIQVQPNKVQNFERRRGVSLLKTYTNM